MRGIAILGIMLHNYCHLLGFAVKENEYTFTVGKALQFWDKLTLPDHDILIHILSFFGHYGVPVFLFVSGYGLVKKYEKGSIKDGNGNDAQFSMPAPLPFMRYHFLKLFRLMIIGYVVFVAVYFLRNNDGAVVYSFDRILAQLGMVINFVFKYPDKVIKPGPYWYFGLMLQLYALYVLVFNRWRGWKILVVFVVLCWVVQLLANALGENVLNHVRYNFFGAVLPFAMGIAYARWGRELPRAGYLALTLLSFVVVLFGSFRFGWWLWTPAFVVIGAVSTVRLLPPFLLNPFSWTGTLSAAIFVMHPLAREIIIGHYRRSDIYTGIFIYVFTAFAMSMLLQYILKYIPKPKI
ncbi:acyltransferase [Prevotella sp. OH937_COT-195]|nr:acyltransferase [Prevotella sp. OH937_COT-195]